MIRLVFLGKLADVAGGDARDVAGPKDWAGLLATLPPALAGAIGADTTKVARNGMLVTDKTALAASDGDEIAFLPPVSGG